MKANVTVTVSNDGTAKVLIAKVGDIADKEFNNKGDSSRNSRVQPREIHLER